MGSFMRVFLVGGAVRDQLLGRAVKDRDWVVVGSTPEEMLEQGFVQVGADFPVFLHPDTSEEYALARQERKTGPGYHGFETRFDPSVTIEDDLRRRDLTMNAMARDEDGTLIDPYNGQEDLENGVLRHVSEAFAEDPVRVLRVARFAARYDFEVHEDTVDLMRDLVRAGELDHLTPERVWAELEKAVGEDHPSRFFWTLEQVGATQVLFPELHRVIIETGFAMEKLVLLQRPLVDRMMTLFRTSSHEQIESVCSKVRAPTEVRNMAMKFVTFHRELMEPVRLEPEAMLDLMKKLDLFRHPDHALKLAEVQSVSHASHRVYDFLRAFRAAQRVTFATLAQEQKDTLKGAQIGEAIDSLRLEAVRGTVVL